MLDANEALHDLTAYLFTAHRLALTSAKTKVVATTEFESQWLENPVFLFDHPAAQAAFGASVFWLRRLAALEGEVATIEQWQVKRDGSLRGVIEIVPEAQ